MAHQARFFITGTGEKLESFLSTIRKTCNIVEMVRSGIISLSDSEKIVNQMINLI